MAKSRRRLPGTATTALCLSYCVILALRCSAIYAPETPGTPDPEYCTVFNHMVKSGGTTIKEQLLGASHAEGHKPPGLCTTEKGMVDQCREALYDSNVIMGLGELLRRPLHKIGRDCEFFTMLRHPISRLVSAFYYCPEDHDQQIRRPEKWCGNRPYPESETERLLDFAKASFWAYLNYTEMLYGIYCRPDFPLCDEEYEVNQVWTFFHGIGTEEGHQAFTQIQETMRSYKAVGIFEHWELSMQLFDATVRSSVRNWDANLSLNRGVTDVGREALLQWAYLSPEIHDALATDILIYEFAMEIFKEQTRKTLGKDW